MRASLLILHRYVGLTIAAFLILAGLSGALLSWDREIDRWINGDLYTRTSAGPVLPLPELIRRTEAAEPRGRVTFAPLSIEEGENARFTVRPRTDPRTGELYVLPYTHVFVDPTTGELLGRRDGDGESLSWRSLVPFVTRFHYSLHLPTVRGADLGLWFTGTVALAWFLHSLAAIFLTFPRARSAKTRAVVALATGNGAVPPPGRSWWQRWKPSWRVRWRGGRHVVNFDMHRAGALWAWPFLLVLAFTAASQNLWPEGPSEPLATDERGVAHAGQTLGFLEAAAVAESQAARLGWSEPASTASYDADEGVYNVYFVEPDEELGNADIGVKTVYVASASGRVLGHRSRWSGDAGDIYLKLQFPLHSLRIAGLPGRILISILGLLVVGLSVTGIILWARRLSFSPAPSPARTRPSAPPAVREGA